MTKWLSASPTRRAAMGGALAGSLAAAVMGEDAADARNRGKRKRKRDRRKDRESVTKWCFLEDTYWIVPTTNLPSVIFEPDTQSLIPVYHITGYREGYFWGKNVTQLGSANPRCSSLIGSVTPDGKVLLNFVVDGSETLQQGYGAMVKQGGQWTMLNQTGSVSFSYWAYMVQSKPGDETWESLPGTEDMSVETFLGQGEGDGPQPVTE